MDAFFAGMTPARDIARGLGLSLDHLFQNERRLRYLQPPIPTPPL
jgi:hypothetical protein